MEYWIASWEQRTEMTWRKGSWQMRLLETDLPCSGKLWQNQRWKLFLTSGSETQGPLSLPALHSGVHGLVLSSSDQWSLLRYIYPGTRWVFLVPR